MGTDTRIWKSRKLTVAVAALLGADDAGCERPIDSASAPSARRAELWGSVRCRVNSSGRSLCTSPTEGRIERGMRGNEIQRATFFLQAGRSCRGEGSLYDAAQRLSEKTFTMWRNGLDDSGVLFLEY